MWSWLSSLFSSDTTVSTGSAIATKSSRAPAPDATNSITLRHQVNHLFCQYLLDSNDSDFESNTGKQIFAKLSKSFSKPEIDTSSLPRQPSALPKLIRMLNDDSADIRSLSAPILSDPNLTGKILQVANSPMFRVSQEPIESIEQAIFILGKDGVRNLVSTSIFSPMMTSRSKDQEAFTKKAWQWALINAASAECLARHMGQNPSQYYLWGLFPPLAYLLIYQEAFKAYRDVNPSYHPEGIIVERLLGSFSWHFCKQLTNTWNLPKTASTYFAEMALPASYKNEHHPLADAMLLSQTTILNSVKPGTVDTSRLGESLKCNNAGIKKALALCEKQLHKGNSN